MRPGVVFYLLDPSQPLARSGEPGMHYFAKVAVSLRGDDKVVASVPKDRSNDLAISWASSPNPPGTKVVFDPCGATDQGWTTYPGGFYFNDRQCATIVVSVNGRNTRHRVPLGASCT